MSTSLVNVDKIEELLVTGNLAQLTNMERVAYVNKVCDTLGINPLTRPFDFLTFQGKMVMYAKKDCTDQLRKVHGVSIRVTNQAILNDLLTVTVEATDKTGRVDSDMGAINIAGLKGDALANATMKALTKAKRRVTLSICGLGILDETEIESGSPFVASPSQGLIVDDVTFKNIRDLLVFNKKEEAGLLTYINKKFKTELKAIEEMEPVHIEEAYRAMGGNK